MKKIVWFFFLMTLFLSACKKNSDESSGGFSAEDLAIYNKMISIQEQAATNYITWSATMDSTEAVNRLYQFFQSDPTVAVATMGSQGIMVEYTNGMRGGIILNPERDNKDSTKFMQKNVKYALAPAGSKVPVNNKKMIYLSAAYDQFKSDVETIFNYLPTYLARIGYNLEYFQNEQVTLDRYCSLAGFGIIRFDSHGVAYPNNRNLETVYLMAGEVANVTTSQKYAKDILNKSVFIAEIMDYSNVKSNKDIRFYKNVYWVDQNFIIEHNDFTKDTTLIYGGFCYSDKGHWGWHPSQGWTGTYFGYDWAVSSKKDAIWFINLMDQLSDTTLENTPFTVENFMNNADIPKSYQNEDGRVIKLWSTGVQSLTLWQGKPKLTTTAITSIRSTSANSGGIILNDGGQPVLSSGICWSTSHNPINTASHTSDGTASGSFVSAMTALTPNTTYYVRAWAKNIVGTSYGNEISFTSITDQLAIGSVYGGGIIACIFLPGDPGYIAGEVHGFICAPADQSSGAPWGCFGTYIGGTSELMGAGLANTNAIVAGCSTAGIAAQICKDLVLNGISGWCLPSLVELGRLQESKAIIGGFSDFVYWSSWEHCNNGGQGLDFSTGWVIEENKEILHRVRAIKYF